MALAPALGQRRDIEAGAKRKSRQLARLLASQLMGVQLARSKDH